MKYILSIIAVFAAVFLIAEPKLAAGAVGAAVTEDRKSVV